jgi:hypothetical protein
MYLHLLVASGQNKSQFDGCIGSELKIR